MLVLVWIAVFLVLISGICFLSSHSFGFLYFILSSLNHRRQILVILVPNDHLLGLDLALDLLDVILQRLSLRVHLQLRIALVLVSLLSLVIAQACEMLEFLDFLKVIELVIIVSHLCRGAFTLVLLTFPILLNELDQHLQVIQIG